MGAQKLQMDSPPPLLSLPPLLLPCIPVLQKKPCLIGGNTGRSMSAYAGPIFSKQQEGVGWGSSETTVAVLPCPHPFSPCQRALCYRRGGKAFSPPSVLCFHSSASWKCCQERATVLKERNKWQRSDTFGLLGI